MSKWLLLVLLGLQVHFAGHRRDQTSDPGSIRKISIKQDGRTIAEFPLTFGVVGAAMAPALAAIGAIAGRRAVSPRPRPT